MASTRGAVREEAIAGRGQGLVAARDIAAGESVVIECALLTGATEEFRDQVCACCLRGPPTPLAWCTGCSQVLLCGRAW